MNLLKNDILLYNINKLIPLLNSFNYYLEIKNELVYVYNSSNLNIIKLDKKNIYSFTKLLYLKTKTTIESFNTAHFIIPSWFKTDYKKSNIPNEYLDSIAYIKKKYINIICMKNNNQYDLISLLNILKTTSRLIYYKI